MMRRFFSSRALSIALLVSLGLNLLLGGAVAAHFLRGQAHKDRFAFGIERMAETMPAEDGNKLRAAFAARAGALETSRAELRQARESIRHALRAQPFDPAALERAMTDFGLKRLEVQKNYQAIIAGAAAEMSPDSRAKLAEWPVRRGPHGHPSRTHHR